MIGASTFRLRLSTAVTVASAGILALSIVASPSRVEGVRIDGASTGVYAVELTAFALAPSAESLSNPQMLAQIAEATGFPTQTTGAAAQSVNVAAIQIEQAPSLDLGWVISLFDLLPNELKQYAFVFVLIPMGSFFTFVYNPIADSINVVLDAVGLPPFVPIYRGLGSPTPAANPLSSTVAPLPPTTDTQSGEPLSTGSATETGETPSTKSVTQTGTLGETLPKEPLAGKSGKTADTSSTESLARTGETLSTIAATESVLATITDTRTPAGETLSTTTAKLDPVENDSPALVGQRSDDPRRPAASGLATPAAAGSDAASVGKATSAASTSAGDSTASSSASGDSNG